MKIKVSDWNKSWAGKHVVTPVVHTDYVRVDGEGTAKSHNHGTLTGIINSKSGYGKTSVATVVRVAYEPAVWADWPVDSLKEDA